MKDKTKSTFTAEEVVAILKGLIDGLKPLTGKLTVLNDKLDTLLKLFKYTALEAK
jgi:hypothetical protein